MSTTTETTATVSRQMFYIDEGEQLYRSYNGETAYLTIPVENRLRLAQETVIHYMRKGFSRAEILSGEALPDRTPPKSAQPKEVLSDADKAMRKAARKAAADEKKALVKKLLATLTIGELAALVPDSDGTVSATSPRGNGAAITA